MTKKEQFISLLKLTTDSLTKDEFLAAFKDVLDYLKKAEANLGSKIDSKTQKALNELERLGKTYEQTITKIEEDNQSTFSNLKRWALEKISELWAKKQVDNKLAQLDAKLTELNSYEPPNPQEVAVLASRLAISEVQKQIPTIDSPDQILDKISGLLEIQDIKDLQEKLDELKKIKGITHIGGSSGGGHIVKAYDLTASLNGVLKTFSLPAFWRIVSVHSSSFPFSFRPTTDYTISGSTITFTSEIDASTMLSTGTTITIIYSEP